MIDVLAAAVLTGLGAFFCAFAVREAPFLSFLRKALMRLPHGRKLVLCPFCLPFWIALPLTALSAPYLPLIALPLVPLGAAAVSGWLGSVIIDDGLPDED